jgi:cyclophilin family peptidyl-prolyl cis-trans isomerase
MHASPSRRPAALPIALFLLTAALFVAACGGSSGGSTSSQATTTSATSSADTAATTATTATTAGGGASTSTASSTTATGKFCGQATDAATVAKRANVYSASPGTKLDPNKKYVVEVKTTDGTFDVTVDQKHGPTAAANFVGLVKDCYYDGIVFHRVIKGFMVQTGDPQGSGTGGPGYQIKDDKVTEPYKPGVVAMANAGPDTGGSQFFVVQGADVALGPNYSIFGNVDAAGMKTIDKIANAAVTTGGDGAPSSPTKTIQIQTARLVQGG